MNSYELASTGFLSRNKIWLALFHKIDGVFLFQPFQLRYDLLNTRIRELVFGISCFLLVSSTGDGFFASEEKCPHVRIWRNH